MNDDCLKLTAYFGERHRTEKQFVADALLDLYGRNEVEVSVMLRGAEGFGLKHRLRTDRILTLSEDLPLVSVSVDTRPRIENLLEEVISVKRHGLITLERARLLTGEIGAVALPEELHEATKLTIYVGRQEQIGGSPAFVAVCDLLHRRGVAGATALLGVDGTVHGVRRRARFFGRNAEVPMMIVAVGAGERIARVLPELGGLLTRPLLTLERVHVCKRDGQLLSQPRLLPATDEQGLAMWQLPVLRVRGRAGRVRRLHALAACSRHRIGVRLPGRPGPRRSQQPHLRRLAHLGVGVRAEVAHQTPRVLEQGRGALDQREADIGLGIVGESRQRRG